MKYADNFFSLFFQTRLFKVRLTLNKNDKDNNCFKITDISIMQIFVLHFKSKTPLSKWFKLFRFKKEVARLIVVIFTIMDPVYLSKFEQSALSLFERSIFDLKYRDINCTMKTLVNIETSFFLIIFVQTEFERNEFEKKNINFYYIRLFQINYKKWLSANSKENSIKLGTKLLQPKDTIELVFSRSVVLSKKLFVEA